jgi:hypothetical protein
MLCRKLLGDLHIEVKECLNIDGALYVADDRDVLVCVTIHGVTTPRQYYLLLESN